MKAIEAHLSLSLEFGFPKSNFVWVDVGIDWYILRSLNLNFGVIWWRFKVVWVKILFKLKVSDEHGRRWDMYPCIYVCEIHVSAIYPM